MVMSILSGIMEQLAGKVHLYVAVGKKPALELFIKDKEILVEIKNPVLALELGLEHILSGAKDKDGKIQLIEEIKSHGYKIRVKYKMMEMDI